MEEEPLTDEKITDIFLCEDVLLCVSEEHTVREYLRQLRDGDQDILPQIFTELRNIRTEYAIINGYENYYAVIADRIPQREYLYGLREYVLSKITPHLPHEVSDGYFAQSAAASLGKLGEIALTIPKLGEFYSLMKNEGKITAGNDSFTVYDGSDLPEMCLDLTGKISDIEMFFHELGHAYDIYLNGESSYLLGEIRAVMTEFHAEDFMGKYRDEYKRYHVDATMTSIAYLNAMCELSEYIYGENIPVKDIDEKYMMLMKKYTGREVSPCGWLYDRQFVVFPQYKIYHLVASCYGLENNKKYGFDYIMTNGNLIYEFPET